MIHRQDIVGRRVVTLIQSWSDLGFWLRPRCSYNPMYLCVCVCAHGPMDHRNIQINILKRHTNEILPKARWNCTLTQNKRNIFTFLLAIFFSLICCLYLDGCLSHLRTQIKNAPSLVSFKKGHDDRIVYIFWCSSGYYVLSLCWRLLDLRSLDQSGLFSPYRDAPRMMVILCLSTIPNLQWLNL